MTGNRHRRISHLRWCKALCLICIVIESSVKKRDFASSCQHITPRLPVKTPPLETAAPNGSQGYKRGGEGVRFTAHLKKKVAKAPLSKNLPFPVGPSPFPLSVGIFRQNSPEWSSCILTIKPLKVAETGKTGE
jgi:hypothetical protein